MNLEEYTESKKEDAFIYWLEFKLIDLCGMRGGTAFKFGIFRRSDLTPIPEKQGHVYGTKYAWSRKYGDTPNEAFKCVHGRLKTTPRRC